MSARPEASRSSCRRAERRARRLRGPSRLLALLLSSLAASLAAAQILPPAPNALPGGGKVVVGAGVIRSSGAQMTIDQSTSRLGLDWQSFNIGSAASVDFRQPSASSIALNRVVGNEGSAIYGKLTANGRVFLTNPNGVLFAPGAKVDVGALVASTLDLAQSDFAAGLLKFKDTGSAASVVNQGRLAAAPGGYIGLFGRQVDNEGEIAVRGGSVLLASGRAVTLAISDNGLLSAVLDPGASGEVGNRGLIDAPGSTVTLTARSAEGIAASLVNNSGIVRAASIVERNGEILLTGDDVATSGTLAADGSGTLSAGRVVLQGDMARGQASVDGILSATAQEGSGGFIETSAARVSVADGARVRTLAPRGRSGLWLIDPTDYTIAASGGNITGAALGTNLAGGPITIASTSGTSGTAGNINVNDAVTWSANKLTLNAQNNINVNAALNGSGTASLAFEYGQGSVASGNASTYTIAAPVTLPAGANFSTKLGSNGALKTFTVVTNLTGLQAIDGNQAALSANYALGASIDASGSASLNGGLGFSPIGNESSSTINSSNSFTGVFDGLGNTISALSINLPSTATVGLFASTSGATVQNLILSGGAMTGRDYVGALAGIAGNGTLVRRVNSSTQVTSSGRAGGLVASATATFDYASASGAVTGVSDVGGLVGAASGSGSISHSSASGNVTGTGTGSGAGSVGGLVGDFRLSGGVSSSTATGQVSGGAETGGLIGYFNSNGDISSSTASGAVSSTVNGDVGGLLGYANGSGSLSDSSATGNVSAPTGANSVGGLVGEFRLSGGAVNSNAGASGRTVAGGSYTGGLIGYYNVATAFTSGNYSGDSVSGNANTGGLIGYMNQGSIAPTSQLTVAAHVTGTGNVGGAIGRSIGSVTNLRATGNVTGAAGANLGGLIGLADGSGGVNHVSATGAVTGANASGNIGGLVGRYNNSGTLSNGTAIGNVSNGNHIGGLVGYAESGAGGIDNSTASGDVSVAANSTVYAGGLVGLGYGGVAHSTASGKVNVTSNGTVYAGGLVGYLGCYYCSSSIADSSATGSVTVDATNADVGGLVGYVYTGSIDHASASGNVSAVDSASTCLTCSNHSVGGLVGYFDYYSTQGSITNSTASGSVSGRYYTGGLVGQFYGSSITDSSASGAVSGTYYVGGLVGYGYGYGALSNVSATGNVTSILSGSYGTSVGGLLGYFYLYGGALTNGFASGNVVNGASNNSGYTGGLAGQLEFSSSGSSTGVNDSAATGSVSGGYYTGGLVGYLYNYYGRGSLQNSHASGNVVGANYTGGLVGYYYRYQTGTAADDIANSYATGNVSGTYYAGGLAGYFQGSKGIRSSYATGSVTGLGGNSTAYLGGLVGYFYATTTNSSTVAPGLIRTSYASGDVSLPSSATVGSFNYIYAGGLVGYLDGYSTTIGPAIADAYATGKVALDNAHGRLHAGGLVGYDYYQRITRAYASGAVSALNGNTRTSGGLVATGSSVSVTSSYWDSGATGQSASNGGGTALTSAQMKQSSNFAGWSIRNTGVDTGETWRSYDGYTAPLLAGFLTPASVVLADTSKTYDGNTSFGNGALSGISHPERVFAAISSADAGTYTVAASGVYSAQNGYDLSVSGSAQLTIAKKPITLAGLVADKVYDSTRDATFVSGAQPAGLVAGEDLVVNTSAAGALFDTKNVGQDKTVTVTGVALADGAHGKASNYTLGGSTTTASITPAPLTVGSFSAVDRVYDGSTAVAVTVTPSGSVVGKFGGDDVAPNLAGVNSGTVATKDVGTTKAVTVSLSGGGLTGADAGNYQIAGADAVTVNITPKALTVNGITGNDRGYNRNTTVSVSTDGATLSGAVGGDTVQLSSNSVNGTMADKNVAYDGGGTVIAKTVNVSGSAFTLRGADAANYTVQDTSTTAKITPYTTYVYASRTSQTDKVYDGTTVANVNVYLGGGSYSGDSIGFTNNAPTYSDKNVAYSGSTPTTKTITVSNIALTGSDAGNYVLSNSKDGGGNYYATTYGTISPLPLTVTGVSAVDRAYDRTTNVTVNVASASVNTSALIVGDDVTVTLPGSGTVVGTMADKNVGNNKAVAVPGFSLSGAQAGNYTLTGASSGVTVNIAKKNLTASYSGVDKVYDGGANANVHVTSADIVAGDTVNFYADVGYYYSYYYGYAVFATTGSTPGSYTTSKNVGTGKTVVVTSNSLYGADAGNYNLLNPTGTTTADITPKPVTLAFSGVNKIYDGTDAATVTLNKSASGIYSGDSVSASDTASFAAGKAVGTGKTVNVGSIVLSGTDAGNYTVSNTTATTTAHITPKTVTLSGVAGVDRPYNGTTTVAVTATGTLGASGFVPGDDVQVSPPGGGLSTGTMADKAVGTNKAVAVTGLSLSGTDAGNYSLDNSGVTVNITPKSLTASYTGVDRVYNGGVTAQVTGASADVVGGDTVTFSQNAVFTGIDARNAGTAKPIAVSNIAIGGTDAANYALQNTIATTTASITSKPITVSYTGVNRVYDGVGDTSVQVLGGSTGIVALDNVTFSQTAVFHTDGSAGANKVVDVSGISLGGPQAVNYALTSTTASTTATVTQRPIGVSGITAANRVYDGTRTVSVNTSGATVDASAVIPGDAVSVVLPLGGITTGTVGTKDAGSNKDVTVTGLSLTGAASANYTVTGASGLRVNIAPKSLTAVYTAADKVYDGSALATIGWTSADLLAGDTGGLGLTASGVFAAGKNVGSNKTVTVSGAYLTGAERNNYALQNPSASVTATISPLAVTASYSGDTKVYDGSASAPVHGYAGFIAGDQVGLSQTAVFSGAGAKNVGSGKAIDVSAITLIGGDAGNYALTATTAGTFGNITPKSIAIQGLTGASAVNRVYDGTRSVAVNVTTSGTLAPDSADIVTGDDVTINLPVGGITTGTMADKNAGSHKAVVVDGLSLTGADAGNYVVAATSGITVDIARKSLTASYTGLNKIYDGAATAAVSGTSADILGGDTVTISGQGIFTAGKNAGTGKSISITAAQLGSADGSNYLLTNTTGSASADITPKSITPSYTGGSRVYDRTANAPVTSVTSGFVAGDDIGLSQTAVFNAGKNVGNNKTITVSGIALTGNDKDNYALSATGFTTTGSITPKPLRIDGLTGVTATDRDYDGTRTVTVNIQSTGTLTPNAQDLISGDTVGVTAPINGLTTGTTADKNVGTAKAVTVAGFGLNGADAGNYSVSASSGVTVNITPKSLTANYTGVNKVYDGTASAVVAATSSDIVTGDAVTINPTASFDAGKAVGTGKAVTVSAANLSDTDAGNYLLVNPTGTTTASITPKTVNVTYSGGTKVYDRTTTAPVSANAAGLISGDDVSLSQTAVFTGAGAKNVGTNKPVQISGAALSGGDAGNYTLVPVNTLTTASITPRPVTVDGLTDVHAVDRAYDGTRVVVVNVNSVGTVGAHPGDILSGDDVSVSAPNNGQTTGTMADKNVGSGKAVVVSGLALSGADAGNYTITGTQGVAVNITPKSLTATWTGSNKVYDGTTAATVTGSSTGLVAGDQVTFTASGIFDAGKTVGIGKAVTVSGGSLSGTDAPNYALSNAGGAAVADITPRNVNAAFTGGTKVYDGTTGAPVTVSASSGLVSGDDVQLDASAVFTGAGAKNVGNSKPVQVSNVTLSGADAGNYNLLNTTATTTASITPKPVTIGGLTGISALDRTYDGTRVVQVNVSGGSGSASTTDFITGDDVYVTGSLSGATTGLMQDKNVGSNKPVAVTGLSLGGADAGNYQVSSISGVTVNITPLALQVAGLRPVDRVYDGTRAVTIDSSTATASGAIGGDDVQVAAAGATGEMADKNVGAGKAVQVTGVSLSGADKDNYTFSAGGLSVNITPRTLVVQASVADRFYDGTTNASATLGDNRITGDELTLASSGASFDSKNAGTGKTVTVSGLAISGTDASNYTLGTTSLTTLANILRAPVTVVAADQAKVYGNRLSPAGTEFSASGVVSGESIDRVSLGSTGLDETASVGAYALTPSGASGTNFDPANYLISYTDGRLSVSPRPLSIAAKTLVRYVGDTTPLELGFSPSVGGLVNGDHIGSVTIPTPADLASAIGGSVFTLTPSGATFDSGDASNYLVNYQNGLLILLPKAPIIGEAGAGRSGAGEQVFVITVSAEEIQRAADALNTAATTNGAQTPPAAPGRRVLALAAAPTTAPPPGDGRTQISVPDLLRLPLIALDPQMRRLIFGSE